jgi:DNA-binding MarR family transcriptional regulator
MTVIERCLEGLILPSSDTLFTTWDESHPYSEHLDHRTGEVLTDRGYESWAWEHHPEDDTRPFFEAITSLNQRDRFMEGIDKRKLVRYTGYRQLFDRDRGSSALGGRRPMFTKPVYRSIEKLVNLLDYQNYLYTTADALAEKLEIHPKSVTRQLRSLGALVRVRSQRDGMRKGILQIAVSPAYGYRMEPETINENRYVACTNWYRATSLHEYADRFDLVEYSTGPSYPYYGLDAFDI